MPKQPRQELRALFRLFRHEDDEPIVLELEPYLFQHYIAYDGRIFKHEGATLVRDYPAGYRNRVVCGWDFQEVFVRSLHPAWGVGARCIVCNAPFPLHTIRCGTAA